MVAESPGAGSRRTAVAVVIAIVVIVLALGIYVADANGLLLFGKHREYQKQVKVLGVVVYKGRLMHEDYGFDSEKGTMIGDGYSRSWNADGVLARETVWEDSKAISIKSWNDDGTLSS